VLDGGRLVEHGPWDRLAAADGHFAQLVAAAGLTDTLADTDPDTDADRVPRTPPAEPAVVDRAEGSARAGQRRDPAPPPRTSMVRAVWSTLRARPLGLLLPAVVWELTDYLTSTGLIVGWLWASLVVDLEQGSAPWLLACAILAAVVANTLLPFTIRLTSARWWADSRLRLRLAVLRGQTAQPHPGLARGRHGAVHAGAARGAERQPPRRCDRAGHGGGDVHGAGAGQPVRRGRRTARG
jgi:hypothetical protein